MLFISQDYQAVYETFFFVYRFFIIKFIKAKKKFNSKYEELIVFFFLIILIFDLIILTITKRTCQQYYYYITVKFLIYFDCIYKKAYYIKTIKYSKTM